MEPPPLTVTKKRDPLRIAFEQQDPPATSGPLQVLRPSLQPGPFLQSAADAAAINRSVEAQRIRREFDALVGASPLPQAVRQPLSVISYQQRLAALQGSYSSPAATTPAPRSFQLPPAAQLGSGAALASRLQHGLPPTFSPAEPQAVPAARYHSAAQQWQQAQPQHVADGSLRPGANVEVETSKFTRVLHSHSPSYQAVVSSTVEVVRQTSARPLQQPQVLPLGNRPPGLSAAPAVVVEELPTQLPSLPARPDVQQAQQPQVQQQHNPPPQQQPVVVLQLPVLRSPPSVPCVSTQGLQPAAASPGGLRGCADLAALGVGGREPVGLQGLPVNSPGGKGSTHSDRIVREPAALSRQEQQQQQPKPHQPEQQQFQQQQAVEPSHEELAAPLDSPAGTLSRPHSSPELGGVRGVTPTSMQKAMAQVDTLVRDLSSPMPDEPPEKAGCEEEGQVGAAALEGVTEDLPAGPGSAAGLDAGRSSIAAQQPTADAGMHYPSGAGEQQQQQQEQQQELGQPPQPAAQSWQATAGAGDQLADKPAPEPPLANPASSSRLPKPRKSTKPSKAGVSKESSKRVKVEGADAAASRKRTGVSREAAALARSAQVITGKDGAIDEGTMPKRARLKPLPYWTNPRVVFNANKEVVAVEGSKDLLGLSDQQRRQQPQQQRKAPIAGGQAVKLESNKAQKLKAEPSSGQQHDAGPNVGKQARAGPSRASKVSAAKEPKAERKKAKAAASADKKGPGGKASEDKSVVQQKVPQALPVTSQRGGQGSKAGGAGGKTAGEVPQMPEHPAAEQQEEQQQKPAKGSKAHTEQQKGQRRARHGKLEVEAAKQLQHLGNGAGHKAAAENAVTGPSSAAAAGALGSPVGMHRLAALALSAGVHAAQEAGRQRKARMPAAQAAPDEGATAPGGAAVPPAREGGQAAAAAGPPALPGVEGVPPDIIRQLAGQQPNQRHRCGHCRNCQRPQAKAGCLALRALREQEAPGEGAATPASGKQQRQSTGKRQQGAPPLPTSEKPLPASAAQQGQPSQPPEAAGGAKALGSKRRVAEAAAGKQSEPASKKARVQQPVRQRQWQRQQQLQQQQQEREPEDLADHPEEPEPADEALGGGAHVLEEAEEEVLDEQGWTGSQATALQRAWLQINPTAPNFWQLVAKQVPGKTATECYNRHMAKHPTPPPPGRKAAPKKLLAAAKEGPRMPELKPGASKQVVQNAARKYARQLQWQQKANKVQALGDGGGDVGEGLLEEMEVAEKKGRYIDQILRKRQGRPLGMAARGRKPALGPLAPRAQQQQPGGGAGGAAALQGGQAAPGVRKLAAADTERDVRAALIGMGPQHDSEEDRDSLEGEDYYWSDA